MRVAALGSAKEYNNIMHRLLAGVLLLSFSFSLVLPAVFSGSESQLPACCRTKGKHGCSMKRTAENSSEPSIKASSKCPSFPVGIAMPPGGKSLLVTDTATTVTSLVAHPAGTAQTEAGYRVSFSRAWQKRGPPLLTT